MECRGRNGRVTSKACKRPRESLGVGDFMAQKALWNITKKRSLEDRGALPKEEGDFIRDYKAMHEEHFSVVGHGTTQKVKPKKK